MWHWSSPCSQLEVFDPVFLAHGPHRTWCETANIIPSDPLAGPEEVCSETAQSTVLPVAQSLKGRSYRTLDIAVSQTDDRRTHPVNDTKLNAIVSSLCRSRRRNAILRRLLTCLRGLRVPTCYWARSCCNAVNGDAPGRTSSCEGERNSLVGVKICVGTWELSSSATHKTESEGAA